MIRRRRGAALILVLTLIVLVAAAAMALAALVRAELIRAAQGSTDAQLRQMLLAGSAEAMNRADHWPDHLTKAAVSIRLPEDLASSGGTLRMETIPTSDANCEVHLNATLGAARLGEVLSFNKPKGRWELIAAEMDR